MPATGVIGQAWRATVTPSGSVVPHDGTAPLRWFVAADDRWHDPDTDRAVRHRRVAGTAVFETKVRVPGGDAVQRVWSVADGGGITLVSVHNESSAPFAVAFTRDDLATSRPPADVPIRGIDLAASSIVLPVGHRASITVGLAHGGQAASALPSGLPDAEAVARGWIARTDSASRLVLPEPAMVESVRAARCELLLDGLADADDEPERHLVGLAELVRLRELHERDAIALAPLVGATVEAVATRRQPLARAALEAAGIVLALAGERRALGDLAGFLNALPQASSGGLTVTSDDIALVPAVERRIAAGPELFPDGIPPPWRGTDFEAHGLLAGPVSRLSLAVRWHGANAAVLWEVDGEPVELRSAAPTTPWSTSDPRGEMLWVLV